MLQQKFDYLKGPTENSVVTPDGTKLIANSNNSMLVYDITNVSSPTLIKEFKYAGIKVSHGDTNANFLDCNNNCFALSDFADGALVVDINTGASKRLTFTRSVNGVAITGNTLILGCSDAIRLYDITTPSNPIAIRSISTFSNGVYVNAAGTLIVSVSDKIAQVYNNQLALLYTIDAGQPQYQYLAFDSTTNTWIPTTYLNVITSIAFIQNRVVVGCISGCIFNHDDNGNLITPFYPVDKKAPQTQVKLSISNGKFLGAFHDVDVKLIDPVSNSVISTFDYGHLIGGYPRRIFAFTKGSNYYFTLACNYRGFGIINVAGMTLNGQTGLISKVPGHGSIYSIVLNPDGKTAYLSDDFGFRIIDMTTGNDLGLVDYGSRGWDNLEYDITRKLVFIPATYGGLKIVDVSNSNAPKLLYSNRYNGYVDGVKIIGSNRLLVMSSGVYITLDTTNPSSPGELSRTDTGMGIGFLALDTSGTYVYGASGSSIVISKITGNQATVIKTLGMPYTVNKIVAIGNRLYVSIYTVGLQIYTIDDPANPQFVSTYNPYSTCNGLFALNQNTIYTGMATAYNATGHLMKLDMTNPTSPVVLQDIPISQAGIATLDLKGNMLLVNLFDLGALEFLDTDITPPPTTGTLDISSIPLGAEIFIDGQDQQKTTRSVISGIPGGINTLKLTLQGYQDYNTTFSIIGGRTTTLSPQLTPISVLTYLYLSPPQVNINVGQSQEFVATALDQSGRPIQNLSIAFIRTPFDGTGNMQPVIATTDANGLAKSTFTALAPGTNTLQAQAQAPGGGIKSNIASITVQSVIDTGTIAIISDPPGAAIYIDGNYQNMSTPGIITGVQTGPHMVSLIVPGSGYYPVLIVVVVHAGKTTNVSAKLTPINTAQNVTYYSLFWITLLVLILGITRKGSNSNIKRLK